MEPTEESTDHNASTSQEQPTTLARKRQPSNCYIVDLPVELVLMIAEWLSPASKIVLSQTCRSTRYVFGSGLNTSLLTRYGKLEYLALVGRDDVGSWLCDRCVALHPINYGDVPRQPRRTWCPKGLRSAAEKASARECYGAWHPEPPEADLDYRHVQLALKYARIGGAVPPSQRAPAARYFAALMAPYRCLGHSARGEPHPFQTRTNRRSGLRPRLPPRTTLRSDYCAAPRIVLGPHDAAFGGARPRFVLFSDWELTVSRAASGGGGDKTTAAPRFDVEDLGHLDLCAHLALCATCPRDPRLGRAPPWVDNDLRAAARRVLGAYNAGLHDDCAGVEIRGACARCPVDFAVRYERRGGDDDDILVVGVRAWHDFGPEASPMRSEWLCHRRCPLGAAEVWLMGFFPWGPLPVYHEPGSVREMYGPLPDIRRA
ncbi:hypothetical protein GGR52DRAFT_592115 [Hypoxylon sp. FL1284]|nr:hypothetical protein GGR52DRAFT_592115 [Hypoxylon sp. FL1284]